MGATKGYELIIRTISTVGNYDYLFDYTFQLDGTIEIVQQPWLEDDWGQLQDVHQQKIVRKFVTNESDALLDYPKNYEGVYVIVNQEELNRWGYRRSAFGNASLTGSSARGYAIHPGMSPIHLTNLDSKRTENNVNFAKHHLAISRSKESEPSSSTTWNLNLPGAPHIHIPASIQVYVSASTPSLPPLNSEYSPLNSGILAAQLGHTRRSTREYSPC
ncbi:copper amine oxidase [Mycena pura]|uniref:Amine oxidase n=1 Tax=Mycena pura TaxID=153505 RepID=A0AAD7E6F2_9AGAR|nr:copper amine oxidase [Mycena pura]